MNEKEMNAKFKKLARLRSKRDELEAEIEALENEFKAYMEAENKEELKGKEHSATYKLITSMRFDSKLFRTDHKEMYEAYRKPSSSMRFTFA